MVQLFQLFRLDPLGATMLALILIIAWCIFDFSRIYLRGEAHLGRHLGYFLLTIGSAGAVAVSDNLLLLACCWSLTGIAVHRLLLFYPHRPFAQLAARKKFLLSGIADFAMLGCCIELWHVFHTLSLSSIAQLASSQEQGDINISLAAVCAVAAVAIRCAQIPFHGWILQVMEAPTPVSALLHAGVVNIGGFVLLRLAPIIERSAAARDLLIIIGGFTMVIAAIVMTTRVSIKVSLAWSTCAQMGCMLVEAGIGAYPLVLLHLVGHSFYKSYAFLHAGNTVELTRCFKQSPTLMPPRMVASRIARLTTIVVVAGGGWLGGLLVTHDPSLALGMLLAAFAVMHVFSLAAEERDLLPAMIIGSAAMLAMYMLSERVAQFVVAPAAISATYGQIGMAAVVCLTLAVCQSILAGDPRSSSLSKLHAQVFAGFFFDEILTRYALFAGPLHYRKDGSHAEAR